MSREGALKLVERMKTDQALRDQIATAKDEAGALEIIRAAGYDVDAEDKATILSGLATSDAELTEAQLESVTGGTYGKHPSDI